MTLNDLTVQEIELLLKHNIEVTKSLTKMLRIVPKRSVKHQQLKDQIDDLFRKSSILNDVLNQKLDTELNKIRIAKALINTQKPKLWELW